MYYFVRSNYLAVFHFKFNRLQSGKCYKQDRKEVGNSCTAVVCLTISQTAQVVTGECSEVALRFSSAKLRGSKRCRNCLSNELLLQEWVLIYFYIVQLSARFRHFQFIFSIFSKLFIIKNMYSNNNIRYALIALSITAFELIFSYPNITLFFVGSLRRIQTHIRLKIQGVDNVSGVL